MKSLKNRVAVVTGAGSGIGRALALRLAKEGCDLALADWKPEGLAETAQLLAASGRKVTTRVLDVSKKPEVEAFAVAVRQEHGKAHLLFNNAGVALHGLFTEYSDADLEWIFGINFWGVIHGTRAFLPLLREQDAGHIINLSSIFGIVAPPGQTAYVATKFAVRGFSESLRHELARTPVRVTVVHPGGIQTNIATAARVPEGMDTEVARRRTQKFNQVLRTSPDDAADTILRAVQADAPRVLIGSDARAGDWFARRFPGVYWKLLEPIIGRDREMKSATLAR